jgi:hypothetical protein
MKNTSISLRNYFDQFVTKQVTVGRYKNATEFTTFENFVSNAKLTFLKCGGIII